MPTREQIQELVEQGKDYEQIGQIFGIPAGEAYLIGTGSPADNSAGVSAPPQQSLSNPTAENPTSSEDAEEMARERAQSDAPMQQAKVEQSYEQNIEQATAPSLLDRIKSFFGGSG